MIYDTTFLDVKWKYMSDSYKNNGQENEQFMIQISENITSLSMIFYVTLIDIFQFVKSFFFELILC